MVKREETWKWKAAPGNFQSLGAVSEEDGVNFALVSETEEPIALILYKKGEEEPLAEIPFPEKAVVGNVFGLKLQDFPWKQYEYNYRIGNKVVQDPYGRVIKGRKAFGQVIPDDREHQVRCGFAFEAYDWGEDDILRIPYEEGVMYQLHVRGFTKQKDSRVRHKGTFLGLQEKAEYLKSLGINQIMLMPAYEFDEVRRLEPGMSYVPKEERTCAGINYWGYIEGNYFAPKYAYCATSDPVKEFKNMVAAFHKEGIEVLMEFFFPWKTDVRKVSDCLSYWRRECHVDGFRLLGDEGIPWYLAKDPVLADTKLICTYFPGEEIYGSHHSLKFRNLAECNDGFAIDMRRLLKGDEDQLNAFVARVRKNPYYTGVLNYMTSHDGFTLVDLVSYDQKHNEENGEDNRDGCAYNYSWNCGVEGPTRKRKVLQLRMRQMKNAFLMMLLSAGTPMLLAGDEFGNSQGGNNNPYCLDNEVSWVDWKSARRNEELTSFVKDAIAFRRRYKILHMERELRVMDTLSCGYPDVSYHGDRAWYGGFENVNRQVGIMYYSGYAGEENFIYAAYNLHWEEHEFALPNLPEQMKWYKAIDTGEGVYKEGQEPALEGEKTFQVPGRTIVVLIGRK